jgi:hypothetical protein
MAYGDFTLDLALSRLSLTQTTEPLFPTAAAVAVPTWLTQYLARNTPVALSNEKARSESLIAPVLSAVRETSGDRIAVFSGPQFNVDPTRGLVGECDFLLTLSPPIYPITAPVIAVAEAKRGELDLGMGQCVAEMVAAREFNRAAGLPDRPVFGCVTSGETWLFYRLDGDRLRVDSRRYYITQLPELLGAFRAILEEYDRATTPAP